MLEDSANSSSSDTDIEAVLKIENTLKIKKCMFCGNTSGSLIKGSPKTLDTIKKIIKIRLQFRQKLEDDLQQLIKSIEDGGLGLLIWHKSCYCSYISKRNIELLRRKHEIQKPTSEQNFVFINSDSKVSESNPSFLRKSVFEIAKCVFCQKRSNKKRVSQVLTLNLEKKIKLISQKDSTILKRIGTNDLIAMEVKYHPNCFLSAWSKYIISTKTSLQSIPSRTRENTVENKLIKALQKGLSKNKVYRVTKIFKRYNALGGKNSKRQLMEIIKNHFGDTVTVVKSKKPNESDIIMSSACSSEDILHSYVETSANLQDDFPTYQGFSEYSVLHSIICDIKKEMDCIPEFKTWKNLNMTSFKQHIPKSLIWLITMLITNDNSNSPKDSIILSLCQDIIFTYSRNKTPKHIALGIIVHQETRSKKIIQTLHECGHSISYKDVLSLRNTIAQEEINKYIRNDFTVIPSNIVPNQFVQFAADNIDILEETLDKSPTFHATQMVAFQQRSTTENDDSKEFTILPYKIKLNVPENFHRRQHLAINSSTKPTPVLNKVNLLSQTIHHTSNMRYNNVAWVICRNASKSFRKPMVPQWSGFHKLLKNDCSSVTSYGYLPLLPYVASDYDTLWTLMKRCESISRHLNIQHVVITFDQALYYKAKEIQWFQSTDCDKFIIRLGGFHIMLNFLRVIGQYMEHSGLKDIWLESDLYGDPTISGIFKGKKWNKGIRAHKLTYESLLRILFSLFEAWLINAKSDQIHTINNAKFTSVRICNNIKTKQTFSKEFNAIVSSFAECDHSFSEFIDSQSPTFKFWVTYLELIEILLEFLYSERSGNWELHLQSLRKMVPWFFAFDHSNYSRWTPIYLADMLDLPSKAPEIYQEFCKGSFVIKRLPGTFNMISVDQALEHVNKVSKDSGGIVGLTKNSTKLDEWYLSFNDIGSMIDSFLKSMTTVDDFSQNIETGPKRMMVDENSVLTLQEQFNRFKVFKHEEDCLLCVSTNSIIPKTNQDFLLNAKRIGEEAYLNFIERSDSDSFYKPIKKLQVKSLSAQEPSSKKAEKNKKQMQAQDILQRLIAVKEMGRPIKYEDIFKYELSVYPMSLAINETLNTPTNKSNLVDIITSYGPPKLSKIPHTSNTKICHIFDGMSVVQALGKPVNAKTFGEYSKIFSSIIFRNQHNATRIDLVLDNYQDFSIKNVTRIKRGSKTSIDKIIDSPNVLLPQQWNLFINSTNNKQQLTDFLSVQLTELANKQGFQFVTSGGYRDVLKYSSNFDLVDDLLKSNHEEADTRILLHILSAKKAGYNKCVVECKDTDVFVLLCHFRENLIPEIWIKTGKKGHERFTAVQSLLIDPVLLINLPGFHAITGCDTTSQLSGMGKKSCWKVYLKFYRLFDRFGLDNFDDTMFNKIHNFILKLYTNNEDIESVNSLRGILATSKTLDKLPPTENSLRYHCLRAHYQTIIWRNAVNPIMMLPNVYEYGWKNRDGILVPILQTLPPFPQDLPVLSSCGCKKDCKYKWCTCKKNQMPCIGSCRCMGEKFCSNISEKPNLIGVSKSVDHDIDED